MVCTDIDEHHYIFKWYGKTIKRAESWIPRPRSGVISWNASLCQQELDDNCNIDSMTDDFSGTAVPQIIMDNWDSFCEVGTARSMLDSEFCIDTGNAKTICCRQPKYGVHETKIMSKQIYLLEKKTNGLETVWDHGVLYYSW